MDEVRRAGERAPNTVRRLAIGLVVLGGLALAWGWYIPAKAVLAQVLLTRAWSETAEPDARVRPWPWAEIWPVARLLVPSLELDAIVVSGAEGASLAFGPGHVDGTGWPWESRSGGGHATNTVIAGHRDTHFRALGDLRPGDELWLEGADRRRRRYRVVDTRIVHETETEVLRSAERDELTLVTCYPFDAVTPGGPLRYVVRAESGAAAPKPAPVPEPAALPSEAAG